MLKFFRILSIVLLLFTGINAVIAGLLFIAYPDGCKLGMTVEYLRFSPFTTYLIPGIILFVANGMLNLFAAIYGMIRKKYYSQWVILQGILLTGWVGIQMMMVRDVNFLHIIMLFIGMVLIACGGLLVKNDRVNFH